VRRCPVDTQALMETASSDSVVMGGDGTGHFIFPALHPAIDGLIAIGKLLELLIQQNVQLSEVVNSLSPFFMAASEVVGSWEIKGRVMRCLMEQFAKFRNETLDGIKVFLSDDTWVLIRPDADQPVFHIIAEAKSLIAAQEIVADYGGLVRNLVITPCAAPSRSRQDEFMAI
jgi:mannose-1-phosphate guanylyltransferase/phosphomannomutase